jgi:hypothetical protein
VKRPRLGEDDNVCILASHPASPRAQPSLLKDRPDERHWQQQQSGADHEWEECKQDPATAWVMASSSVNQLPTRRADYVGLQITLLALSPPDVNTVTLIVCRPIVVKTAIWGREAPTALASYGHRREGPPMDGLFWRQQSDSCGFAEDGLRSSWLSGRESTGPTLAQSSEGSQTSRSTTSAGSRGRSVWNQLTSSSSQAGRNSSSNGRAVFSARWRTTVKSARLWPGWTSHAVAGGTPARPQWSSCRALR